MSPGRDTLLLRALRGEATERTPVWLMRQAGRVLPEYLKVREKHSFLDVAQIPEVCAEVTVQPIDRLGVDGAILFSDILMPLQALGVEIDFRPGPVLEPWKPSRGIGSLRVPDPDKDWAYLRECVQATVEALHGRVPLIGFAGAPFTVATYLLEGGSSKEHDTTRRWMNTDPKGFREFLFFLADRTAEWLGVQVRAGVRAYQLFDTWASILSPGDQERFAIPAARRVFERVEIPEDFPTIYFAPGAGAALSLQASTGAKVLGIDWRVRMEDVRAMFPDRALQGNLDPGALLGSEEELARRVRQVLEGAGTKAGHIFNLGHGILPMTKMEQARLLVRLVHDISRELRA